MAKKIEKKEIARKVWTGTKYGVEIGVGVGANIAMTAVLAPIVPAQHVPKIVKACVYVGKSAATGAVTYAAIDYVDKTFTELETVVKGIADGRKIRKENKILKEAEEAVTELEKEIEEKKRK